MHDDDVCRSSRFIFMRAWRRSKATLVQNVLDSHPEIYGGEPQVRLELTSQKVARRWVTRFPSPRSESDK